MIQPKVYRKQRGLLFLFIALSVIVAFISFGLGDASVSYNRILPTIMGEGTFKEEFVLFSLRLPRIIVTFLSGIALALSGAILQTVTRNDLAEPGIIGINSGAGVAVALFFLFAPIEPGSFVYLLPLAAFGGALVTSLLIYFFAYRRKEGLHTVRLILVGVGFSMALSGLMVVIMTSARREKVDFIANWLAGNIWGTDWPFILALLPWLIVLIPYAFYKANTLNLLNVSDPVATGVGVPLEKERAILLLAAVALAASAVSVSGGIAFIGLMAPHLAKALIGPRHQLFLPLALVLGGGLLLLADTVGRNLVDPDGIPAGIMSALIGAPYFMYLLIKKV
ncbi:iron ABC transporter permease [Pontibacillus halophilus JSM 076056 = DSM 19796]|uniref:Iron ABC transporter permease n=1 Tax=Pontibacillus halophilus JSM 076056 = DSM 19796 TaxID=1385510 RepID=A0A0A5I951_9BACI|nr:iron ABC transporter permease [Pontibacillus halophilus]KGX92367.1 iron ABC transporter permease [Pontibacillus halophilus JSM 076056 = DSM 19796]